MGEVVNHPSHTVRLASKNKRRGRRRVRRSPRLSRKRPAATRTVGTSSVSYPNRSLLSRSHRRADTPGLTRAGWYVTAYNAMPDDGGRIRKLLERMLGNPQQLTVFRLNQAQKTDPEETRRPSVETNTSGNNALVLSAREGNPSSQLSSAEQLASGKRRLSRLSASPPSEATFTSTYTCGCRCTDIHTHTTYT